MSKLLPLSLAVCVTLTLSSAAQTGDAAPLERARALHKQVPLIDGHNDYPWAVRENVQRDIDKLVVSKPRPSIHTDSTRRMAAGDRGQSWWGNTPCAYAVRTAVTARLERRD